MKDPELYHILDRVACICSRFNVTIKYVPNLEVWVIQDMNVPSKLCWHYTSIYAMLFGSSSIFIFSAGDISYFSSHGDRMISFATTMASLKSDSIEELNIKLDLLSMECS